MKLTLPINARKKLNEIKKKIEHANNPYFLFDDDPDGLSSFLLLYKKYQKGNFSIVRGKPRIDQNYFSNAIRNNADLIVILDKPEMSEVNINIPIVWIDHHPLINTKSIYYNPLLYKLEPYPTTYWVYQIVRDFEWIASIGIVGDWYLLDLVKELAKKPEFKELFPKKLTVENIFFNSRLGNLIKLFSFTLKGKTYQVKSDIRKLIKIESPQDLEQYFPRIKIIEKEYKKLLNKALNQKYGNCVIFLYSSKISHTGLLSNELLYHYPKKDLIIVGRRKLYEYSLSLRSKNLNVATILKKSLIGIRGTGGGHDKACGAMINSHDIDLFLDNLCYHVRKQKEQKNN